MNWNRAARATAFAVVLTCTAVGRAAPKDYFAIHVVDEDTGRGVPLTYLRTTYKTTYVTDSNGYVAFNEPGLMDGRDVWFEVKSYGYEQPAGAFGVRGVALKPAPGKTAEVKIKRKQIAERLYRLSGYGIYRDTVLLGKTPPIKEGLINAQVTGQDTVQTAVYRGKMYWLWQDTDRLGFGLGGFSMTGGTSALPDKLDADKGIDIKYFVNKPGEFAKSMAYVPREGTNPIWLDSLTVVKDKSGRERMIGKYIAAKKDFSPAEQGILVYNDEKDVFERLLKYEGDGRGTLGPGGHPFYVRDGNQRYVYYSSSVRVKADFESASDPKNYEAFTCLGDDGKPQRVGGKLKWDWKTGGKPIGAKQADELVKKKLITPDESPWGLKDVDSGKTISVAGGAIGWNPYIKKWTIIFGESFGESPLGEIWLAIANAPEGPWTVTKKVATHAMEKNNNDLYNVVLHNELSKENGKLIYFSGTFVNTFSGNPWPTPYYDYNNIMYKIDLSDPRMKLPEPPAGLSKVVSDDSN